MTAEELEAERAEQQSIADNGELYLFVRFRFSSTNETCLISS